jgi:hypothetical protein
MNSQNFNRLLRSDEKKNLSNSQKKLNSSFSKISSFNQINFRQKNYDDEEKKNLNELSAKNNLFQNNQKNSSIFNM